MENLKDQVSVRYYPNPTSGLVSGEILGLEGQDVTLEVVNLQGQILEVKQFNEVEYELQLQLDLSKHSSGTYLLRLSSKDGQVVHRINLRK